MHEKGQNAIIVIDPAILLKAIKTSCGKVIRAKRYEEGSVAKNLAPLQNQKKPSQLGKLIIFIRKTMTHKGERYSVKMSKYFFCNGTLYII